MRKQFTAHALTIGAGQTVSGVANSARVLRILSGRVWITVEGISNDYWLFAGDTFTLTPGALTVIEADAGCSRIELAAARRSPALLELAAPLRRLAQRFARGRNTRTVLPSCAPGPSKRST